MSLLDDSKVAGRILIDTNLVNRTLECGGLIFENGEIPATIPQKDLPDVLAFEGMFLTGSRANW